MSDVCNICGGIHCSKTMCIYSPPGTLIKFTCGGGYKHERKRARKILILDEIYMVNKIEVYDFHSTVTLEGMGADTCFNTSLFENLEQEQDR